jgi:hypothetical protein
VVLVIQAVAGFGSHQVEQVGTAGENFGWGQNRMIQFWAFKVDAEGLFDALDFWTKLAIELVATDAAQVITAALEERATEVVASRLD